MNNLERKILRDFPGKLDQLVKERFGEETECQSSLDLFGAMNYHTCFKAEGKLKEQIDAFIAGFMAGNEDLRHRLINKLRP